MVINLEQIDNSRLVTNIAAGACGLMFIAIRISTGSLVALTLDPAPEHTQTNPDSVSSG